MAFNQYAQYYDILYKNKRYDKECDYLEALFKKYKASQVKTILDLGCGTASHSIALAKRGFKVTGIDASSQMLKIARQKIKDLNLSIDVRKSRLQTFELNTEFDVMLCMFSVIDYITLNSDVKKVLSNVRTHMKRGSLFIFDFWNARAVNEYYSPKKSQIFKGNNQEVLERNSTTTINPIKKIAEVHYTCKFRKNGQVIDENQEKHVLRYFDIDEMKELLESAGFKVLDQHPFLNVNGTIRKNTWDVTMVACKS